MFECIKSDPEKLARMIYLTPYSREIYEKAYKENPQNKFERALNFYIKLNMGHGFRTTGEKVGWKNDVQGRERAYAAKNWCDIPEMLLEAAERLRGVQIENRPATELMERFNYKNVLIYLDPPYMPGTRHGKQYKCEMFDHDSHENLLETAKAHKGPVLISGYDSELYNDMLKNWHKEETISYSNNIGVLVPIPENIGNTNDERYVKFENPTELSDKIYWKLWAIRHPTEQIRKKSMVELLFCMLRSEY